MRWSWSSRRLGGLGRLSGGGGGGWKVWRGGLGEGLAGMKFPAGLGVLMRRIGSLTAGKSFRWLFRLSRRLHLIGSVGVGEVVCLTELELKCFSYISLFYNGVQDHLQLVKIHTEVSSACSRCSSSSSILPDLITKHAWLDPHQPVAVLRRQ